MHTTTSAIIEDELSNRISKVELVTNSDAITFIGPILYGVDDVIRNAVDELQNKKSRLLFVLETSGGYIEVAQRIADVTRHHYQHVDFLVPSHAMSAGTVLAMSGDSIWMDYYSVLGPIDPQVEGQDGQLIPALGYLEKYQELIDKAGQPGGLNDAELAFLLKRFDPGALYRYEQEKELSIALLMEWLCKYKFKDWTKTETQQIDVTPQLREERAKKIAEELK